MKRICIILIVSIQALFASLPVKSTNVWNGRIALNWSEKIMLFSGAFKNLTFGDVISVKVCDVAPQEKNPQLVLKAATTNWPMLVSFYLNKEVIGDRVDFVVTSDIITAMRQYGLVLQGCECTVTSIDTYSSEYSNKQECADAIWFGKANLVSWHDYVHVPCFLFDLSGARPGDIMRISYQLTGKHNEIGALRTYYIGSDWDWYGFQEEPIRLQKSGHIDFPVNSSIYNRLIGKDGENGLVISGIGLIITAVHMLDKKGAPLKRKVRKDGGTVMYDD